MALKARMPLSAPTCAPVAMFCAVGVDRQSDGLVSTWSSQSPLAPPGGLAGVVST